MCSDDRGAVGAYRTLNGAEVKERWRDLFKPQTFRFLGSLRYRFLDVILLLIMSGTVIIGAGMVLATHFGVSVWPGNRLPMPPFVAALPILVPGSVILGSLSIIMVIVQDIQRGTHFGYNFPIRIGLAPLLLIIACFEIGDDFRYGSLWPLLSLQRFRYAKLLTIAVECGLGFFGTLSLAGVGLFVILPLIGHFGVIPVCTGIVSLYALGAAICMTGLRKERRSNNPLIGIFGSGAEPLMTAG